MLDWKKNQFVWALQWSLEFFKTWFQFILSKNISPKQGALFFQFLEPSVFARRHASITNVQNSSAQQKYVDGFVFRNLFSVLTAAILLTYIKQSAFTSND